jgi:hypothetical protein
VVLAESAVRRLKGVKGVSNMIHVTPRVAPAEVKRKIEEAFIDVMKISQLSEAEVRSAATNLYDRWTNLPFEDKRQVVEAITDKVVIAQEDIDISFLYAPTSEVTVRLADTGLDRTHRSHEAN